MEDSLYVCLTATRRLRIYEREDGSWYYKRGNSEIELGPGQHVENSKGDNRRCSTCNSVKKRRTCRNCYLQRTYGITEGYYRQMWRAQGGKCYLCKIPFRDESHACVDHDHKTGRVRQLLCEECNLGLGNFKDNPAVLRKAAKYVEDY